MLKRFICEKGHVGFLVVQHGNRHSPYALSADAPVRPVGKHALKPLPARFRHHLHATNLKIVPDRAKVNVINNR